MSQLAYPLSPAKVISPKESSMSQTPNIETASEDLGLRISTLAHLRDSGWVCCPERFSKWRQLFPNRGELKCIGLIGYAIATDGVHVIVYQREADCWIEASLPNWREFKEDKRNTEIIRSLKASKQSPASGTRNNLSDRQLAELCDELV